LSTRLEFEVVPGKQGMRLDVFLADSVSGISRSYAQKLIKDGAVSVNTAPEKASYRVRAGDTVCVALPAPIPDIVLPERIPLDILFEDEHLIVINKPRGMVVHPAPGHSRGTLVNALLEHCHDLSGIQGTLRPGIVHRLDKDTSGVMVVAKSDVAHLSLAKQIKDRTVTKTYLAIVKGNFREDVITVDLPIGRHAADRKKMAVNALKGRQATTVFSVLERFGGHTLLSCHLLTGRTHQIRVHLAYIGHPVIGDLKYGKGSEDFPITGQALHSAALKFVHPIDGRQLGFTAPLPQDMKRVLAILRQKKMGASETWSG